MAAYGSDQSVDEAIAQLVQTQIGERPMYPDYGVPDTAFAGLSTGDVQVGLTVFGPDNVTVNSVVLEPVSQTRAVGTINWSWDTIALVGDENG